MEMEEEREKENDIERSGGWRHQGRQAARDDGGMGTPIFYFGRESSTPCLFCKFSSDWVPTPQLIYFSLIDSPVIFHRSISAVTEFLMSTLNFSQCSCRDGRVLAARSVVLLSLGK
jgi:hypothetical protein